MKISHFSDTHGLHRKPVHDEADVIVLTGDICPNLTRGNADLERVYQAKWLHKTGEAWRRWAKGKPLVLVPGNHDFFPHIDVVLRAAGVAAFDASHKVVTVAGRTFFGIADIPWMGGGWNHECGEMEIKQHFDAVMAARPDVVVNHCPLYGVLDDPYDRLDYHIGSTSMVNALTFHEHEPKAYLHGHCHERGGQRTMVRSTIVSNAATKRMLIDIG